MARLNLKNWRTPQSYGPLFEPLPESGGIYAFVSVKFLNNFSKIRRKILYVGMSQNIKKRVGNHPTLRKIHKRFDYICIYFLKHDSDLRMLERYYIQKFNPPYNIIGRRGEI